MLLIYSSIEFNMTILRSQRGISPLGTITNLVLVKLILIELPDFKVFIFINKTFSSVL